MTNLGYVINKEIERSVHVAIANEMGARERQSPSVKRLFAEVQEIKERLAIQKREIYTLSAKDLATNSRITQLKGRVGALNAEREEIAITAQIPKTPPCPYCRPGMKIIRNANFCYKCGRSLS